MSGEAIVFGRVPGQNIVALRDRLQHFVRHLEEAIGHPIRLRVPRSYEAVLEAMEREELDVVLLGPELWLQALDTGAEYDAVIRPIRAGARSYRGQFVCQSESDIVEVRDLRGRSLALVNKQSVAGYIAPLALLRSHRIEFDQLSNRRLLGSHENVLRAVLDGRFDAGVTFEGAEKTMSREGLDFTSRLRVFDYTDPIPNEPLALSRRFSSGRPDVAQRFVETMTTLHLSPAGQAALRTMREGVQCFEPITEPRTYESVRRMLLPGRPRISMIPGASMAGMRRSWLDDDED